MAYQAVVSQDQEYGSAYTFQGSGGTSYTLHFVASVGWWAQVDLNHRPRAYQARALTS